MADSRLMRVSATSHDLIRTRAAETGRTLIAEHDRIVEAGIAALRAADAKPARTRRKTA